MLVLPPDGHMMYMGKDKYENEDLIRYGFPEDVWFHVDNLSSAHVYLRMNRGEKVRNRRCIGDPRDANGCSGDCPSRKGVEM